MTAVLPEWLVKVIPPADYDQHTAVTGHCHHGKHERCHGTHKKATIFSHTWITSRRGVVAGNPVTSRGGTACVYLTVPECFGCHCECHQAAVKQLALWDVA